MRRATLLLTRRDIERLMTPALARAAVRAAFITQAKGQASMPEKVYLTLPGGDDFRAMPAWLQRPSAAGMKWVNVHTGNPRRGLPTVMAVIVLNDPATGFPLAIMDGTAITKLRTAAASAVAARALARRGSRIVGLVGCGAQANAQLLALAEVVHLREIRVWGRRRGEAVRFVRAMRHRLPNAQWRMAESVAACVQHADLIVTLTPSRRPLVRRAWVASGAHINAVGADAPGKQELDWRILRDATVVVDHRDQAIHAGEINVPITRRQYHPRQLHGSLGEVLTGRRRGRRSLQEITVFDSTGLAIHDVALAFAAFRLARQHRLGREINLV